MPETKIGHPPRPAWRIDEDNLTKNCVMNSSYDDVADWYDSVMRAGNIVQDAAVQALHDLAGNVKNLRICDLACGQGYAARSFADCGASVVGVDISSKLLDIARSEERTVCRGIEYAEMNAESLAGLPAESFDGVICNMALMDIGDLGAASASTQRVLRTGGWFVFSIMHPCFQTPKSAWISEADKEGRLVRAYYEEGYWYSSKSGMRGRVGAVHRTLSTYFNTIRAAGFVLEAVSEPRLRRVRCGLDPVDDEVPVVLAASFVKS